VEERIAALEAKVARLEALASVDLETGEIRDNDDWPEWYSLGFGLKGWKVPFTQADAWREKHEYSEAYCLDIIYRVRGWWTKKHETTGRDPYRTFQQACRDNWGGKQRQVPVTAGIPEDRNKYRADFESQKQLRMGA
jgi:hypothetical protein